MDDDVESVGSQKDRLQRLCSDADETSLEYIVKMPGFVESMGRKRLKTRKDDKA